VDVNAKSSDGGQTPLHLAIPNKGIRDSKGKLMSPNNMDLVELLIAKGADVNAKCDVGWTPLHNAQDKEIVELLIAEGADVNAKTNLEGTPLDQADGETADLLRKHGGKTGEE